LALALASVNAFSIPDKYAHYKPGYMRIPGWQKNPIRPEKIEPKGTDHEIHTPC